MHGRQQQVRFGPPETPNVIKILLIANVGVFILQNIAPQVAVPTSAGVIPTDWVTAWFAAWPERIWSTGAFWQPATYMWLHSPNSLGHIAFNMFALWMFGSPLASAWGDRRFLQFYLLTGLGAGLVIATWPLLVPTTSRPSARRVRSTESCSPTGSPGRTAPSTCSSRPFP